MVVEFLGSRDKRVGLGFSRSGCGVVIVPRDIWHGCVSWGLGD